MTYAITVKYIGPTDTKSARIQARCELGKHTIPYEPGSNDRFDLAAVELAKKFNLPTDMTKSRLSEDKVVYVPIPNAYVQARDAVIETRIAFLDGLNNGNPRTRAYGILVTRLTDDEGAFSAAYKAEVQAREGTDRK